jgi:hypothetical protein
MHRKHYIKIAAIFSGHKDSDTRTSLLSDLIKFMKAENPNFDEAKFYKASMPK